MGMKEEVSRLPGSPGVYIFKDASGRVIYVGKAKSLKKRVRSYFVRQLDSKTQAMVSCIKSLEYRLAYTNAQAEILEASLVKRFNPQYNIELKDDKSFPWIKIGDEEFPVVSICRSKGEPLKNGAEYFGPYTNVKFLRRALKLMRKIFGFRSCAKLPGKACLYYRLDLCPGPCIGKISRREYQQAIRRIKLFLQGRYEDLIRELGERMSEASKAHNYEEAAKLRDKISSLSAMGESGLSSGAFNELEDLMRLLKLSGPPMRIEAFDISNISGKHATGSMVSFYKASPDKDNYRRFRIKGVEGVDDYAMLREVIARRYERVIREKIPLPDLVIIDGGKGHLLTAVREIRRLGLNVPIISIAKDKENIYVAGRQWAINLGVDTPALNLIRRVRDEAHRFALSYHRVLRRRKIIGK